MIVKVQVSLATSLPNQRVLVYNKDRSIMYENDVTDDVLELLGDRPKAYFKAHLDKYKKLVLDEQAEDQDW
jgi:hypothetical protein